MNFELTDKLSELLESKKLDEAITMAEQEMKNIPTTDFRVKIESLGVLLPRSPKKGMNCSSKNTMKSKRSEDIPPHSLSNIL